MVGFGFGSLHNERDTVEARILDEKPEARFANLTLTKVGVAVLAGAEWHFRIVHVDHFEVFKPDFALEGFPSGGVGFGGAEVVTRSKYMACIQANAEPGRAIYGPQECAELCQRCVKTTALPSGGFGQKYDVFGRVIQYLAGGVRGKGERFGFFAARESTDVADEIFDPVLVASAEFIGETDPALGFDFGV